jgi:sugar O-acyltransferase (sialic acid O-acetyltransferase NeuD family)
VRLVLYAVSSGNASELLETVRRLGGEVVAAIRNVPDLPVPAEIETFLDVDVDALDPSLLELEFAVPQTTPSLRREASADARRRGFTRAATLLDPTASVASTARLGSGCYVAPGAVVGAGAVLGEGCLINRLTSVAHHAELGDYTSTGPSAVMSGECRIGAGAFVGAGAVIAPRVSVGEGAVVGAGAVVIRDVGPGEVVVGNPARLLRRV